MVTILSHLGGTHVKTILLLALALVLLVPTTADATTWAWTSKQSYAKHMRTRGTYRITLRYAAPGRAPCAPTVMVLRGGRVVGLVVAHGARSGEVRIMTWRGRGPAGRRAFRIGAGFNLGECRTRLMIIP
jgi:hypothetical protein